MSKNKKEEEFKVAHAKSKYICTCCNEEKANQDFLINRSTVYRARGRMTNCNKCVEDIYNKLLVDTDSNELALYYLCRHYDYMYSESLYNGSIKQADSKGSNFLLLYLQKVGSLYQYRFKRFRDSDMAPNIKIDEDVADDFILTKDITQRWGKGRPLEDYAQLDGFFQKMVLSCGCEDPIQENTLKNISKTQLQADRALEDNNVADFDKLSRAISTMMKDGGVTYSTKNDNNDDKAMIGMWTKLIEEEEPIPEAHSSLQDIDKLGHYIKTWFVQHFGRVFGITNENDLKYDKPPKKSGDS